MDKLRVQYELHKKYRKNLNSNVNSHSDSVTQEPSISVKNTNSSSAKTVSETIISNGSADTEKTSLTSSTSINADRSKNERYSSGPSYRSLGKVVQSNSLETEPKSNLKDWFVDETKINQSVVEPSLRRKTKSLEKHFEQNSVSDEVSSRKQSCETSTVDTNAPHRMSHSLSFIPYVPTEGQLRWAQFHQKERADATKARVSALMKSPRHAYEVEGALDGDDNSSSSSDDHPSQHSKELSEISSGRRALLRVSARKMEERRKHIQKFGFKMKPDSGNEESEDEQSSNHQSSSVDDILVFDEIAAALQDLSNGDQSREFKEKNTSSQGKYAVPNSKKVKTPRRKQSCASRLKGMRSVVQNADEDEQRMKRFEEAYNLLSNVGKDATVSDAPLITSSKRWSRDSSMPVAHSVDGRIYGDLQRSPTFRHEINSKYYGPEVVGAELNGKKLSDRGASWMIHLPKQDKRKVNCFGENAPCLHIKNESPDFISPQKLKLMQIVDRIQGREQPNDQMDSAGVFKRSFDIEHNRVEDAGIFYDHVYSYSDKNVEDKEDLSSSRTESTYPELDKKIQSMLSALTSKNMIDTDGQSESSEERDGMEHDRLGSLMLSPRILTKRLNQAIAAIATCNWNQVRALIRANQWLADMVDVNDNQYLLHKLSYYGAGTIDFNGSLFSPAPKTLFDEMIEASNAIVHKVDSGGNLPLHLAAESGNTEMISRLCISFPGGASVRNEEGLLPLHLAILSCANPSVQNPLAAVTEILRIFPLALVIADNNGNLPIHIAAAHLHGEIGAQIVHKLVDEAEKQGGNLRISSRRTLMNDFDMNDITSNEDDVNDPNESILFARNGLGWNPLVTAIHRSAGWQVLDAFLSIEGVENFISERDNSGKTILQLEISKEDCDGPSVVSILRAAPNLVNVRDDKTGALPIETACLNRLQPEVITAIVLLDLPIDLDSENIEYRESFGGSWWYLNCECDDEYVDIVDEILELCDYDQKRALCFVKNKTSESLISRSTPKCKKRLRKCLRFAGRYEFVGSADKTGLPKNVKAFEAIDFGADEIYGDDGLKVILIYYEDREDYIRDTQLLQSIDFSSQSIFAPMHFFEASVPGSKGTNAIQRCIATEIPVLTLRTIVTSMNKKKYRDDQESFERYLTRIQKVFRLVAEALYYLHQKTIVHCNVSPESCGKFESGWRLTGLVGSQYSGKSIHTSRMGHNVPPEVIVSLHGKSGKREYSIPAATTASPTCDIWAFGKLMFEVLLGKAIFPHDVSSKEFAYSLGHWNEDNLAHIVSDLENRGVGTLATDLITHCLCPRPTSRPKSFEEILNHSYWNSSTNIPSSMHRRSRSSIGSVSTSKQKGSGIVKRRFQV